MPLRGENVGTAYVRILADGSELPQGIRDALASNDDEIRAQGRKDAEAYQKSFGDTVRRNNRKNNDEVAKALQIGSGRLDAIAQTQADGFFDSLRDRIRQRVGSGDHNEIADQIWTNLVGDFRRTGNFDALVNSLEHLPGEVDRAVRQVQAIEANYDRDRTAAYQENARRITAALESEYSDALRMNADFNRRWNTMLNEAHRDNAAFNRQQAEDLVNIRERYREITAQIADVERGTKGASTSTHKLHTEVVDMRDSLRRIDHDHSLLFDLDRLEERVVSLHPRLSRMNNVLDSLSHTVGRSTGRGSRNDFFNAFGGLIEGITRVLFLGPKLVGLVGGDMKTAFDKAGGGTQGFKAALGSLSAALGNSLVGLGILVAGIAAFLLVLGPIVAAISSLVGILVALTSTIVLGAIGAVGALVGALGPLGFAIGTVILGVTNLSDKMKKDLSEATKGLRKDFSDLGEDVAKRLFSNVEPQVAHLRGALDSLRPVLLNVADAVRSVADRWTSLLDSKGFRDFSDHLSNVLPGMVRTLGRIFSNTIAGIGGLFEGLIPITRRFLGWLESITGQFDEWTNSKAGRKDLLDFFAKAGDSAKSLGDFLGSVWNLLSEILTAGEKTGDSIFDMMTDQINDWTDSLKKNPDALKDWFKNAKETADKIGDIISAVGRFIDFLDSPQNRKIFNDFLNLITELAWAAGIVKGYLDDASDALETFFGWLRDLSTGKINPLAALAKGAADLASALNPLKNFKGFGKAFEIPLHPPNLAKIIEGFSGLGKRILDKIGVISLLDKIPKPDMGRIIGWFAGLAGRILSAVGVIDLMKKIPRPDLGRIAGFFGGLAGRILDVIGFIDITNRITHSDTTIAASFGSLASKIAATIGTITVPVRGAAKANAFGGITSGPELAGEDGPEAVVPLTKPLSQIDPAVRALAAFAQGLNISKSTGTTGSGRSVDLSGMTVISHGVSAPAVVNEIESRILAGAMG